MNAAERSDRKLQYGRAARADTENQDWPLFRVGKDTCENYPWRHSAVSSFSFFTTSSTRSAMG